MAKDMRHPNSDVIRALLNEDHRFRGVPTDDEIAIFATKHIQISNRTIRYMINNPNLEHKVPTFGELGKLLGVHKEVLYIERPDAHTPGVVAQVEHLIDNVFTEDETLYLPEADFRKCADHVETASATCRTADCRFPLLSSGQAQALAPKLSRLAARIACCASMLDIPERKGLILEMVRIGRRAAAETTLQGTAEGACLHGLLDLQECVGTEGCNFWEWDRVIAPGWQGGAGATLDYLRRIREATERAGKIDPGCLSATSIQEHLAMVDLCSAIVAGQSGDNASRVYLEKAKEVAQQINSRRTLASIHIWQGAFRSHPRSSLEIRSGYPTKSPADDFEAGYDLYRQEYGNEPFHLTAGALLLKAQAEVKRPKRRRNFNKWEEEFIKATKATTKVRYSDGVQFVRGL